MFEEIAQSIVDIFETIFDGGRTGRDDETVVECFCSKVVFFGPHLHRHRTVVVAPAAVAPSLTTEPEAGEDASKFGDLLVSVGRNWLAKSVELASSIGVQLPET